MHDEYSEDAVRGYLSPYRNPTEAGLEKILPEGWGAGTTTGRSDLTQNGFDEIKEVF